MLNIIFGVIAILIGILSIDEYFNCKKRKITGIYIHRFLTGGIGALLIGIVLIIKELF